MRLLVKKGLLWTVVGLGGWASLSFSQPRTPTVGRMPADTIYGLGRPATAERIKAWDSAIRPDGKGLPPGSGTALKGAILYAERCSACHGKTGVEGPHDRLVVSDTSKTKGIGNYWPYATTLFDYIRRAMPFNAPGSLTDAEVYSLTAFLLEKNQRIQPGLVIDAQTLPRVAMPAKANYILDDRSGGPVIR